MFNRHSRLLTDIKLRDLVASQEEQRRILKTIYGHESLPTPFRIWAFMQLQTLTHTTHIRNRCHVTGRGRGILPSFGVSRLEFRRLVRQGKIPGIVRLH